MAFAADRSVSIMRLDTQQPYAVLERSNGLVHAVAVSPDERFVVLAGPGSLAVWDVPGDKLAWEQRAEEGAVNDVAWSPDGKHVVVARGEQLEIWSVEGRLVRSALGWRNAMAFVNDGCFLAYYRDGSRIGRTGYQTARSGSSLFLKRT